MKVSEEVKKAYREDGRTKYISLSFPELGIHIPYAQIYEDALRLSEHLVDSNSIEFVGCISNMFKIQVSGLYTEIKGKKVEVSMHTDGTEDEPIPLFKGIVDSAKRQSNKRVKEITAYDELYTKGSGDVAAWYKGLNFPITLKEIRDSLFDFIGITQVEISLPNDDVVIQKKYNPSALQALPVIKAICQINGVFGIMNREGVFDYRIPPILSDKNRVDLNTIFMPNPEIQPAAASVIADAGIDITDFPYYRDANYEDFIVKPVDKVTIRQDEDSEGISYGAGTNNYIIQGNIFAYGLSKDVLKTIAQNIYNNVKGFSYYPFTSVNNGLPFLECGLDAATYTMVDFENSDEEMRYEQKTFYILNRELTGIQNLKDSYSAKGEEYQTEFVTDLQTQIDILRKRQKSEVPREELEENYYNKEEIDKMFEGGGGSGYTFESVKTPPAAGSPYTAYFVQGEIVVK